MANAAGCQRRRAGAVTLPQVDAGTRLAIRQEHAACFPARAPRHNARNKEPAQPMSADQEFARDPLAFMSRNIVIPCVPSGEPTGDWGMDADGCVQVYVREHETYRQGNLGGKVHNLWLAKKKTGVATLKIYWLTYSNNTSPSKMLGAKAGYMFTAGMNMCSLGVGSQDGTGACLVSHANAVGDQINAGNHQGNQAQIDRQNQQLAGVFAGKGEELAGIVSPDNYMSDQDGAFFWNATNFGVLNQQRIWTFYTHRWKKLGLVSYLHGGTAPAVLPDGLA